MFGTSIGDKKEAQIRFEMLCLWIDAVRTVTRIFLGAHRLRGMCLIIGPGQSSKSGRGTDFLQRKGTSETIPSRVTN